MGVESGGRRINLRVFLGRLLGHSSDSDGRCATVQDEERLFHRCLSVWRRDGSGYTYYSPGGPSWKHVQFRAVGVAPCLEPPGGSPSLRDTP